MGQVSFLQGLYQFALHYIAVGISLWMFKDSRALAPLTRFAWLPLAAFGVSFAAHIAAFIILKIILGEELSPALHRPIVGTVWALSSGATSLLWLKANKAPALLVTLLTFAGYMVFVFSYHLV